MHRRSPLAPLSALLVLAMGSACNDVVPDVALPLPETEIAVEPADFLGNVPCSNSEGAMRSYVVTLYGYQDATDTNPSTISSIAVPCSIAARFRTVEVGQLYTVEIDGYQERAEELEPAGGLSSGNRTMQLSGGGAATPRWTTRCGFGEPDGSGGAGGSSGALAPFIQAEDNTRQVIRPCDPLVDADPDATETSLIFSGESLFGTDPCTIAASYSLQSEDGKLPGVTNIPCDSEPLSFPAVEGESYRLYAYTEAPDPVLGSLCSAVALPLVTTPFQCNTLSGNGAMTLSLAELLDGAQQPLCPQGGSYDLELDGAALNFIPIACTDSPMIGPLAADVSNDYIITATIYDGEGASIGGAECNASLLPGKVTAADCAATP